jgi:hypothetical protein
MYRGVPKMYESHPGDSLAVSRHPFVGGGGKTLRAGLFLLGLLSTLLFASSALGAPATVGLGSAASFSVLGGETVTNTGPTTMFGDLGLSPGSSVTGAPHVLGQTHVDDAVAIGAKNALTTAYNDAASRPSNGSAGTDLAGQTFLPGVRTASSSLLLSSGSVTLDAQGDPNAVFIFQIGSTSDCASSVTGTGGGTETTTPAEAAALVEATKLAEATTGAGASSPGGKAVTTPVLPVGSTTTGKPGHRHSSRHGRSRRAFKRHSLARPALPHRRGSFTG